ncbi:hypothetical protein L228DRAFT_260157 [Xylona heveae TC161]|uniref:Pyridoxamine 5'-phosphate oxidase Alr4036 family FMN-binding domain-containing protein n=1 Tax=Xylona heveae (strain CBS 132557 / TC161) TaxID=1328760 RepID=A0A165HCQ8_XYLHT|nr:hypothetical protein L228DRAFT_260157 [Xylona heveae TC161]KZF23311.1 hypothetical protein L228DRAFT_260157 [Xylona heveae TC161]
MSTTTSKSPSVAASWKPIFLSHIGKMPSPEFVFSSLHPAPSGSPTPYVPRARYCVFRGMWTELPHNERNEAPRNEQIYESELPTFTTDVRMQKAAEIFTSSAGHGNPEQSTGSGGGGPVEAVWWVKDVMTQWRITGEAFVIADDIEGGGGEESSGVRTVKSELGTRMRVVKPGKEMEWSWGKEVTAHFGNMSPGMRGSFRGPPPGTPVTGPPPPGQELGQKVTDLNDPIARKNFRVVVIKPETVEQTDLSDPSTSRRWRWTFTGDGQDGWKKEELWP